MRRVNIHNIHYSKTLILTVVISIVSIILSSVNVWAISYRGPDPNDYGDSKALYIVAHTPSNTSEHVYNQTLLQVPIYYYNPDPSGNAMAPTNNVTLSVYDIHRGISGYDPINQYISVEINDPSPQTKGQRFITKRNITVGPGKFTLDNSTKIFRAVVNIRLYNGLNNNLPDWRYMNQVSFRLSLPDYKSRWIIGNSYPNGRFSTIAANVSSGQKTDTYNIPFATPCSVTSKKSGTIHLYDLDDSGRDNEYHNITYTILDSKGKRVPFTKSGSGGNHGDLHLTMTFRPSQRYILRISGISPINLLQYSFPYEGVNYLVKCPTPTSDSYDLAPNVELDHSNAIEAGTVVTASPSIDNSGTISSPSATWELNRTVNGAANPATPISSGSAVFPVDLTNLAPYPDSNTDYPVGTQICYTLMVRPHATGRPATEWEESEPPVCVRIGKKPKTQIWGGDLNVRGDVVTSTSVKKISGSNRTFGSWAEYGIIASGGITGAASGAAYAGPGLKNATSCSSSTLSFANEDCGTNSMGGYASASDLPDVAGNFPSSRLPSVGNLSGTVSPASRNSGTYTAGNLTLSASNLPAGKSIVIKASSTVTINGNQTYFDGPYARISQIPQLVIIANKIVINSSVSRVDAWLIADSIQTCDVVGDRASRCNNQLTVNGPVMTEHLYLYRTAGSGSGAASGDPAEVFNLRADAYLWAISQSISTGKVKTVYTTELPPRF